MIRYIEDGRMVEIVLRTDRQVPFFTASADMTAMVLAVLGRALALYDVELHAFAFRPDRARLLATPRDGGALARFLNHVASNTARGVQRLVGHDGRVWRRRATITAILDDDAAERRIAAIHSDDIDARQAGERRATGAITSARALAWGDRLVGSWIDRERLYEATRRKRATSQSDHVTHYDIVLAPLPGWRALPLHERRARSRMLIEQASAGRSNERGRTDAHASDSSALGEYVERRQRFREAHRAASAAHRMTNAIGYPHGSFPAPPLFVRREAPGTWRGRCATALMEELTECSRPDPRRRPAAPTARAHSCP